MSDTPGMDNPYVGGDPGTGNEQPSGGNEQPSGGSDPRSVFGEYADHPSIKKFKDPVSLAKSYVEIQKVVGKKALPIPESDEELNAVLSKLGRPDKPEAYPDFEDFGEVFGSDEDIAAFKQAAHDAGLLPKQYEALYTRLKESKFALDEAQKAEFDRQAEEAINVLKRDWGQAFNEKLSAANQLLSKLSEETQQQVLSAGLGNNVEFIKMLADMAENYGEGKMVKMNLSPDEAKAELQKIIDDPTSPYYDKYHREHEATVKRVQDLYAMMYGNNS